MTKLPDNWLTELEELYHKHKDDPTASYIALELINKSHKALPELIRRARVYEPMCELIKDISIRADQIRSYDITGVDHKFDWEKK